MLSTIGPLDDETSVHGSPDADGRARAAVYIDSASENTLLRHRGLVETWTVRNQFQIVREFHDAMVGKTPTRFAGGRALFLRVGECGFSDGQNAMAATEQSFPQSLPSQLHDGA